MFAINPAGAFSARAAMLALACFCLCAASPSSRDEEAAADQEESRPFGSTSTFGFRTRVRSITAGEQREFQTEQLKFSHASAEAQKEMQKSLAEIAESVTLLTKAKSKESSVSAGGKPSGGGPLGALQADVAALRAASEKQTAALEEMAALMRQQLAFNRALFGYAADPGAAEGGAARQVIRPAVERAQERVQERAADAVSVRDAGGRKKQKRPEGAPAATTTTGPADSGAAVGAPASPFFAPAPESAPAVSGTPSATTSPSEASSPAPVEPEAPRPPEGGGAWIIR